MVATTTPPANPTTNHQSAVTPMTNGHYDKFARDTFPPWTPPKWLHTYTTDDCKK